MASIADLLAEVNAEASALHLFSDPPSPPPSTPPHNARRNRFSRVESVDAPDQAKKSYVEIHSNESVRRCTNYRYTEPH